MSAVPPIPPAAQARADALERLRAPVTWDLAVVGGGATGLGVALDAAARGLKVVLLEARDFGEGTSSRATKLVHGGVRYLAQGHLPLVREALRERAALLANAPHVAQPLSFVVPAYACWEQPFYALGLKAYDALAGRRSLGPTHWLSAGQTRQALPTVRADSLKGGVAYWDGQFDDARLAILLARTAQAQGALVLNHVQVAALHHEGPRITGLQAHCALTGARFDVAARCVINATGVWVDALRALDAPAGSPVPPPLVAPSQGVHLVVDRAFLPGRAALLVPKTSDGRVLFAVPWLGKTVLGTTDTPRDRIEDEPRPLPQEADFILSEAGRYLARRPTRADVRSAWVGLRPLVRPAADAGRGDTRSVSREHTVVVSASGLVTVTGGKWTTYRAMAEDVLAQAMRRGGLPQRPAGRTADLRLLGATTAAAAVALTEPPGLHLYGTEAAAVQSLPGAERWLAFDSETGCGVLSEAMVRFAARQEMALSVADVLARRCRLLFLDAPQAGRVAVDVAAILADEVGPGFDAPASADALVRLARQYADVP